VLGRGHSDNRLIEAAVILDYAANLREVFDGPVNGSTLERAAYMANRPVTVAVPT
jgi:hypothetical protein